MKKWVLSLIVASCGVASAAPAPIRATTACFADVRIVFFGWRSSALDGDAIRLLKGVEQTKEWCGKAPIVLIGHSDTSEPVALSLRRAVALRRALVARGFIADTIRVRGVGATDMRVPTAANIREAQNRYVEIRYDLLSN